MLHGKLNEKQVVDDGEGKHRGVQERNEKQAGGSQPTGEGNDLLLPPAQIQRHSQLPPSPLPSCKTATLPRQACKKTHPTVNRTVSLADSSIVLEQRRGHRA